MKNLTRKGVCYDLKNSPYTIISYVGNSRVVFFFSSELHRKKFTERKDKKHIELEDILFKKFGVRMTVDYLFTYILLYAEIETRGFFITANGVEYLCLNEIILTCPLTMKKNCDD